VCTDGFQELVSLYFYNISRNGAFLRTLKQNGATVVLRVSRDRKGFNFALSYLQKMIVVHIISPKNKNNNNFVQI